jgi:acyl-homoserine-lactone acylase
MIQLTISSSQVTIKKIHSLTQKSNIRKLKKIFLWTIVYGLWTVSAQSRNYAEHVTIVRDQWGVPHIYGETDADVAYGLAWANCEDDFKTLQENLLPAKGLLAREKGKEGAILDFLVKFLGSQKTVKERYEKDISPEYKAYLEAYCKAVNDYAEIFPKEVLVKKAFPVTTQDVLASYHYIAALITNAHEPIRAVFEGKYDAKEVRFGSNAFAVNSRKSANGNSFLVVNPHVPFEGFFSWYECHLVSNEGMNIMGATMHGGSSVFLGTNENLGWSHTWNKYDMADCYKLKMHPDNKLQYEFDGQWKTLKEHKAKLTVKLKKWLPPVSVKKKFYESVHGPVIKSKKGEYFAIRWGAMNEIRTGEQWWRMNKAKNFDEFYKVLQMNALPRFNIIYADKEGTLFFLDNGIVPKRSGNHNYADVVAGNISETLWTAFYSPDELPQVKNPDCGYVFNTNNTPQRATCEEDCKLFGQWDKHIGFRAGDNNRSERFMALIEKKERVDFEYLKRVKFDNQYPDKGAFVNSISIIFDIEAGKYPDVKDMLTVMKRWNRIAAPDSLAPTYFLLTFDYVFQKNNYSDQKFLTGIALDEPLFIEAVRHAKEHLLKHFGTIDVPLKNIQIIKRGNKDYPMPGFPDALAANYGKKRVDGKYEGFVGDAYTMIVEYAQSGPVRIESLVTFGASSKPESQHYSDQLEKLWIHQQTKPMTMNKEAIMKNAERIYKPGK